jgi:hypothetical protein
MSLSGEPGTLEPAEGRGEATDVRRLYNDLVHLWPLVSPPEEYEEEAGYWLRELRRHLGPGRHAILDLGVGGGHNLHQFAHEFDATAVDLSEGMLEHSRRLNPTVTHVVGDMRTVRLGRTFDAVLIHDAVDYMVSEDDLLAALTTARAHLNERGLLLVAPDFYTDSFVSPSVQVGTNAAGGVRLTTIEFDTLVDPAGSRLEGAFLFLIEEEGSLRVEVDRHVTGIFSIATWERLLVQAGFIPARVDYPVADNGRPMYLWTARVASSGG